MKKLLLIFLFLALNLTAQEISTTGFNPNRVRPDAISTYTIKVENVEGTADLNGIVAKLPEGLRLVDQGQSTYSRMNIVNGVTKNESGINLTLSFAASEEGAYTIDKWVATVGGKEYPLPSFTLIVDANAPVVVPAQRQSAFDPFSQMDAMMGGRGFSNHRQQEAVDLTNLLSAKLILSKENIYIGESVTCDIVLEIDRNLLDRAGLSLTQLVPSPKDTDAFTCQDLSKKPIQERSSSQKIIYKYSTVITPNKVGAYPLSYNIESEFSSGSVFGRAYRFKEVAGLDNIVVSALPTENRPASFTGAIGEFELSDSGVDPTSASVGELLKLHFTIRGKGNFDRISAPKLDATQEWKVYEPTSEFASKEGNSFVGAKTFTYRIVPQVADIEYSPALSFSYFNPLKKEYIGLEIPQTKLSISPAARVNSIVLNQNSAPSQEGVFDIISDSKPAESQEGSLFSKAEFWIYQVIAFAFIALIIVYRRHVLRLKANPAIAKNIREKRAARIQLKYAKKYAFENNPKSFFESSIKAIQFSLARTEDIQAPSITLKDAQKILEKRALDIPEINSYFEGLESLTYTTFQKIDFDLMQLEKTLSQICKKLLR